MTRDPVARTSYQMPAHPPDSALLRRARRGDRGAFSALIERHYPALLASCARALGDADLARDAAQQASLSAMLGLDRLRDDERFGAWLIGIGLNVCRSMPSARSRQTSSLEALLGEGRIGEPPALEPGPADHAETAELSTRVRVAIAGLPPGQRQAVALSYLAGLTHAEIADELGTSPGAVKTRLHKARKSLRAPLFELWKEHFVMTDQPTDLVPMHIAELQRTAGTDPAAVRHIVFLTDEQGRHRLPIWIGPAEATALAVILEDVQLPRPGVYQFAAGLLAAAGGQLREVRITALTHSTFYAEVVLTSGATVDSRPSDALTLALVAGAPIRVAPAVLDQVAENQAGLCSLAQADPPPDDARVIADEVRARAMAAAAKLAARENETAPGNPGERPH